MSASADERSLRSLDVNSVDNESLRQELSTLHKTVSAVTLERNNAQQKFEKLHAVLVKERSELKSVLQKANSTYAELKARRLTALNPHAYRMIS